MTRKLTVIAMLGAALSLTGCGGGDRAAAPDRAASIRALPSASGPIRDACLASERKDRSERLCGCIQAAADTTLSRAEQRRATAFYSDPHLAQEVRQSDKAVDARFWEAYVAYGQRAEQLCG
ncbi:MAG: hypothetical protein Kow0058_19440 [Roseovarius sp.]